MINDDNNDDKYFTINQHNNYFNRYKYNHHNYFIFPSDFLFGFYKTIFVIIIIQLSIEEDNPFLNVF